MARISDDNHPILETRCTACGHEFDAASCLQKADAKPNPGDVSVCIRCCHVMVFDEHMQLRDPNGMELISIAGSMEVIELVDTIGKANKMRKQVKDTADKLTHWFKSQDIRPGVATLAMTRLIAWIIANQADTNDELVEGTKRFLDAFSNTIAEIWKDATD